MIDHLRMGRVSLPIETLIRASGVKRWHIVETTRTQTLAEHSFNVAMLSGHLARAMEINVVDAVMAGLNHDLAEAYIGDVPTPAKNGSHRADEQELKELMGVEDPTGVYARLLKVVDLADGLRFVRMHGTGAVARWAQARLEGDLAVAIFAMYKHYRIGETQTYASLNLLMEYVYETGSEAVAGPVGVAAREVARLANRERTDASGNT